MIKSNLRTMMIILTVLFLFSAINMQAAENTTTVKIKTSAVCGTCKSNIEKAVNKIDGVKYVNLNVKTKIATVKYLKSKTSTEQIREAISNAGYDADKVKANKQAYNKLMKCCRKK